MPEFKEIREFPEGPYTVTGPWHQEHGYPVTWLVKTPHWTLATCPREDVALEITRILNQRPKTKRYAVALCKLSYMIPAFLWDKIDEETADVLSEF